MLSWKENAVNKKIKISPDGSEVLGLYIDGFDYSKFGDVVVINRVSDVYYDNDTGGWRVHTLADNIIHKEVFKTRIDALNFEVFYLQEVVL